ncbi:hypothetical protein J2Y57_003172 [Sphingomonas sp. BE137]|nr:hypothetical protein [Sphingomonas sp. BE137]
MPGKSVAKPEMMRTIDVAQHEVAPIRQRAIGENDGPAGNVERRRAGEAGRRSVEDDGYGR